MRKQRILALLTAIIIASMPMAAVQADTIGKDIMPPLVKTGFQKS